MIKFIKWVIQNRNKIIALFGHLRYAITVFPGIVYKPKGYKVKGKVTQTIMDNIKPGDILIRGYDDYISSRLIGKWSHTGIYVGNNTVIHAVGAGVVKENIIDFCRTDRVSVQRPHILNKKEIKKAIVVAHSLLGKPYDFNFDFNDPEEYSCTELVYKCFEHVKDKLEMKKKIKSFVGGLIKKTVIEPKDFFIFKFGHIIVKKEVEGI
jgi:hypothetical protein